MEWLKYPGILKLVQLARKLQLEFDALPSEESSQRIRVLSNMLTWNLTVLAKSSAGPLACSITLSVLLSGLQSPKSHLVLPVYQAYITGKPGMGRIESKPILKVVSSLITNKDNWPRVPRWSISQIFSTETIQTFTKVTDRYLNAKSSKEVEYFVPKKILHRVAVKIEDI